MAMLDLSSLKKHYKKGYPTLAFFLDVGPEATATSLLPREEMVVRAREVTDDLADQGNHTIAEQWLLTPQGWSGLLYGMRDLDDALEWLERMFDETGLESATVRGGPRASYPNERDGAPVLTAHVALTTRQTRFDQIWTKREERTWAVDPQVTREIADRMVSWCHLRRGKDVILRDGNWCVEFDWEDAGPGVADAVEHGEVVLFSTLSHPLRQRVVTFAPQGFVGFQDVDREVPWNERLSDLLKTFGGWTRHCDYAFVAPQVGGLTSVEDVIAHYNGKSMSFVRHLLAEYVPMPFGLQVLTGSHLDKARNLDDWQVDDLGSDRFIVISKDLPSWFASAEVDDRGWTIIAPPELLESARADFGDMLLTPQVIAERQLVKPH